MTIGKKFLFVLLVVNLLMGLIYFNRFETRATDFITDMEGDASTFIQKGKDKAGDLTDVTTAITTNFSGLGKLLTMIGTGVMVAVASYMGIMYLISSPDKQAALKQQLIGSVVAGVVIFGAYGIWKTVLNIVKNF